MIGPLDNQFGEIQWVENTHLPQHWVISLALGTQNAACGPTVFLTEQKTASVMVSASVMLLSHNTKDLGMYK